MLIFSQNLRTN